LARYYCNNSLLFLGCNLRNDRTLQVFQATKAAAGDVLLPLHFSIEQAPEQLADLTARNAELSRLGITAIWYPCKQYQFVDEILRLAKSELLYRKSQAARTQHFMPR
jgi:23S rRNA A2030 N6-methylase RlmJ